MPDRRTFLMTCGGLVAAPVLAQLSLPAAGSNFPVVRPAEPATVALKIDGWELPSDSEPAVWVQIGPSWRANWR